MASFFIPGVTSCRMVPGERRRNKLFGASLHRAAFGRAETTAVTVLVEETPRR
jgi:hypothetical protein